MNKTFLKYTAFNNCVIYLTYILRTTTETKSGGTKTTVSANHKTRVASREKTKNKNRELKQLTALCCTVVSGFSKV